MGFLSQFTVKEHTCSRKSCSLFKIIFLKRSRVGFYYISIKNKLSFLEIHDNLSSFTKISQIKRWKMHRTISITPVIDQLRETLTYLLYLLLEIVSVAVRWALNYNFKNSSYILAGLFLLVSVPFFIMYIHERPKWGKSLRKQWKCN